ncbi:MAG: hypothetical protein Q8Q88_15855 [Phenylobacterium sp.]|uniref:hypothetical protein n=1 Tax=Phenylobacterium sp. TaxID=1871053 RepID=UPI0027328FC2|nr:hypothetical protein [Phenylobacterium sp.]MDP3748514.1 hypothetical protein [Phenylobacterium sp.]
MRNAVIWATIFGAAILLAGCTAMSGGARLEPAPHQVQAFGGVLRGVNETQDEPARRRFIFNIHGMGPTSADYNKPLWEHLVRAGYARDNQGAWTPAPLGEGAYRLRGEGFKCSPTPDARHDPPCAYRTFGKYRVDVFSRSKGSVREEVYVYTYFWEADLWALQAPYLTGDLQEPILPRQGIGNGLLKRYVMDHGFSDAVAYLGPGGNLVREGVRGAVCVMMKHAMKARGASEPPPPDPLGGSHCLEVLGDGFEVPIDVEFSFISHSLGSRMLLDALAPYTTPTAGAVGARSVKSDISLQKLADRTRTFFMAANQVPLLGIGRVELISTTSPPPPGASEGRSFLDFKLGKAPREKAAVSPILELDVVAFWDPGDLLGFKVDGGMAQREFEGPGVTYTTVAHRNTPQWAFLFSWPSAAHDREMETASAYRLILCGGDVGASGRLKPRPCF